jgi:phosphoenolpyruvate-protein phosphotransferase/dihydroxyacetone kinase phosphotransfer subunit
VVGIVVVSHSAALADGVVELARQMGGEEVVIEGAGGLADGTIGTDAERVRAAIERAMSDDGVLVLMDLGSALMSAEMAVEFLGDGGRVALSEAPLVEGAVAAAAAARGGASLEEVRAEASGALQMKASQLGEPAAAAPETRDAGGRERPPEPAPDARARIPILNEIGLHARPAALVVELASRYEADVRLAKPGRPGPVSAKSLTGLMTLVARKGDELIATASGPQAGEALAALADLARAGFGEGVLAPGPEPAPVPQAREPPAPEAGTSLRGIPASPGIALGELRRLEADHQPVPERESQGPEIEWQRLERARAAAREAIEHDREQIRHRGAASEAEIFGAHLALLDDDALLAAAHARIDGGAAAEAAWREASDETAAQWRALDDELLRARAIDVLDASGRVLAALAGREPRAGIDKAGIVVAAELTPREAAGLDPELVRGIATAHGTATTHAAILARALGIPAAVGLGPALLMIAQGTPLLLDGGEGTVLVAPDEGVAQSVRERAKQAAARRRAALARAAEPAVTRDGTLIEVAANLGGADEATRAVELGADGVGLLRTEFLFLDRPQLPSEEQQAATLERIATALAGRPLIVRTLDAGADKPLPGVPMPPEANPFLGRRGLRLSLQQPELLAAQLRAILRIAARHPLKLMFPMVATPAELDAALDAVAEARAATGVDAPIEVGIMIEVPAAALISERLARRADFFSIGTNDLTQYTMAAERGNELVAGLLAGPQPAVLRLIEAACAGAAAHHRWVGVCGELAGDPAVALLLVGLGVRELSMAAPLVAEVKQALRAVSIADAQAAAQQALQATDAVQARALAAKLL